MSDAEFLPENFETCPEGERIIKYAHLLSKAPSTGVQVWNEKRVGEPNRVDCVVIKVSNQSTVGKRRFN